MLTNIRKIGCRKISRFVGRIIQGLWGHKPWRIVEIKKVFGDTNLGDRGHKPWTKKKCHKYKPVAFLKYNEASLLKLISQKHLSFQRDSICFVFYSNGCLIIAIAISKIDGAHWFVCRSNFNHSTFNPFTTALHL